MTPLVTPSIHLNGTSKRELVEQRLAVMDAARALLEAMKGAAPNGRDYYPQAEGAFLKAATAWNERREMVLRLLSDVELQAMEITLDGL